jgi:uncharacterized membrane protein YdbT with pleckstrin-like domain
MEEFVIRPTMKLIRAGYTVISLIFIAAVLAYTNTSAMENVSAWVLLAPALLFLWPVSRQIRRSLTKMTIQGDKIRHESGLLTRSTRNIQISKVQDVRVDQSLVQRLLGVGNLAIETAGESSMLTIRDIDDPHGVAERISRVAHLSTDKETRK